MARILYLHRDASFAKFIQDDLRVLSEEHEVDDVRTAADAGAAASLAKAVARADLVYTWWGDLTGVLGVSIAAAKRTPSILITGGYDIADVPEIRYGLKYHRLKRFLPPVALALATEVVANSENARLEVLRNYRVSPDRVKMIPHGLDAAAISPGDVPKERRVLTVSLVSRPYIPYKGLLTFVNAARLLPDVPFVHAGPAGKDGALEELKAASPPNVEFKGFLSPEALLHEMRRATVYAQLSAHEGFGMALAECMLAGASPVVTPVGAIPEVAGDVARYTPYGDVAKTADAIKEALDAPRGDLARRRITELFPIERRRREVLALVRSVLSRRG